METISLWFRTVIVAQPSFIKILDLLCSLLRPDTIAVHLQSLYVCGGGDTTWDTWEVEAGTPGRRVEATS
jgi:hypothetical protein